MIEHQDGPCEAWATRLHAFQANTLSEPERQEVLRHLDGRPACAAALTVSQAVSSLIQRLPWRAMPPGLPPPARKLHAVVYLPTTNQMPIYGGDTRASPWMNDLWILSNANGLGGPPVWSLLTPASAVPAARVTPALAYDQTRNQLFLYGGSHPEGSLGDGWTLTNANGLVASLIGSNWSFRGPHLLQEPAHWLRIIQPASA